MPYFNVKRNKIYMVNNFIIDTENYRILAVVYLNKTLNKLT